MAHALLQGDEGQETKSAESDLESDGDYEIEWTDIVAEVKKLQVEESKSDTINITKVNESERKNVPETRLYYGPQTKNSWYLFSLFNSYATLATCTLYASKFIEESFLNATLSEAAAGEAAELAAAAIGCSLAYVGYTYWKNRLEKYKLGQKKEYNKDAESANLHLIQLKKLEKKLVSLKGALVEQEEKLQNSEFSIERHLAESNKVIIAVGPTGFGKSLFCQRMTGNNQDIEELEDMNVNQFNVAECGKIESETQELSKKVMNVKISRGSQKMVEQILSVVDTPGDYDSKENDDHHKNSMAQYFRACGGINMFCIFFKFRGKMDGHYKRMLAEYAEFWGNGFWKHCVVIITNCDMDSEKNKRKVNKGLPATKKDVTRELGEISDGKCQNVPIFVFGEMNFEGSRRELLLLLNDKDAVFGKKYICDNIRSPIDKIWTNIKSRLEEFDRINATLKASVLKLDKVRQEFE